MKLLATLVSLFSLVSVLFASQLELDLYAQKAILINAKTGAILYEKQAYTPAYPASTTKMATALYTLTRMQDSLDEVFTAKAAALASITPAAKKQSKYRSPPHWLETDGTHIGLKKGEQMPLHDLLLGMMISSANDASNVVALGLEGSISRFMEQLNLYLQDIGCLNTHFNSPTGFTHPEHTTTAYDLAQIAKEAMRYPLFREIVTTERYCCPPTNVGQERYFVQTNRLLRKGPFMYPKALGIKTGTTVAAGKNLVAAAADGDRELIAVLLGCQTRDEPYVDALTLFETAFNEPMMRKVLLNKGKQEISTKSSRVLGRVTTYLPDGLFYDFYPAEESSVKVQVEWTLETLPIPKGGVVGKLYVIDEGENCLQATPLFAARRVIRSPLCLVMEGGRVEKSLCGVLLACVCILFGKFFRRRRI